MDMFKEYGYTKEELARMIKEQDETANEILNRIHEDGYTLDDFRK